MAKPIHIRRLDLDPTLFGDIQILDYKTQPETEASLALVQIKPGTCCPRTRSTRSDKHYYVLNGLVEFQIRETSYWLIQGDLLVIPKGEWFEYTNSGAEAATLILVHTPPFDLQAEEFAK